MRNPFWKDVGDIFIVYASDEFQDVSVLKDSSTKIFTDKQKAREYTKKVCMENIVRGKEAHAVIVPKFFESEQSKK